MEATRLRDGFASRQRPAALRHLPVVIGLAAIIVLAWLYLLAMGWGMKHMDAGAAMALMPRMTGWGTIDLALVFLMWAVMMIAMMLPSAVPMVLTFASTAVADTTSGSRWRVGAFVAGYLAVWTGFSLIATLLQWGLLEARWISPMMAARSPLFAGALLIAAGAFQFTPLKQACLASCRSPLSFILTEWRAGAAGAWVMGLRHGLLCAGCCWLLMGLLFLLGVMNVAWIAALSIFVLVEKTWPGVRWLSPASGALLVAWGAWLLLRSVGG